ncbi:DNA ligase [Luteimonas sp. S4-F44]|uniref:DNA ligase n=1 Tax=Luteimonas sp. S4-F44 TaxID=2925842 RepID=UPI001F5376B5|nr:DNA ligase [Luteimonas sp. S4-F44]UNK42602.1 DNA ligase [Luteimonas sp. S4-F44]
MSMPIRLSCLLWLCTGLAPMPVPAQPAADALMLATDLRGEIDVAAYYVSEKLDGVRGRWDGRALWTRGGHRIAVPAAFTRGWPDAPMDGELWLGRGRFDETSALVRGADPSDPRWRQLRFLVFDLPGHPGPFSERIAAMRGLTTRTAHPHLAMIAQARLPSRSALDARLAEVVDGGGEGLMLHHRDARYAAGRSAALRKLKPFDDAEARVVGYLPGKGQYTGMVGALLVEHADGRRFRIGSGLRDAQRRDPPVIGSLVTYRHNGVTGTGLPRFARFLRVRDDEPPSPLSGAGGRPGTSSPR